MKYMKFQLVEGIIKVLVFSLQGMLCKSITEPPVLIFARSDR